MATISSKLTLHNLAKDDGTYQVRLQVIYQRKRKTLSTGHHLTRQQFKTMFPSSSGKVKRLSKELESVKSELLKLQSKSIRLIERLTPFSFDEWKKLMQNDSIECDSVVYFFNKKIKELNGANRYGTSKIYQYSINKLSTYWESQSDDPLTFAKLTSAQLHQFHTWMLKEQLSISTIASYMRCIRAIYNSAISRNIIGVESYPFGQRSDRYSIPSANNPKRALSRDTITQIENLRLPRKSTIEYYRDMWLLCFYLQGINISDLLRLKKSDLHNGIISFVRKKTELKANGHEVAVYVNPKASFLLKKYDNKRDYLLDVLNDSCSEKQRREKISLFCRLMKYNMTKIAKMIGHDGSISYMNARHSFATLAREHMPDAVIGQALGHKSIISTQNYFARYGTKTLADLHKSMF